MKNLIVGCLALVVVGATVPAARAWDVGIFGSYWDQKDGDSAWGAGILFLPEMLPLEFRGTWYERSSEGKVQANPLDAGLALRLTRGETVSVTAVAGGSYYLLDMKGASPDNEFGWYAGGRVEVRPTRDSRAFSLFGEVLYRGVNLDEPRLKLNGVAMQIGVLF